MTWGRKYSSIFMSIWGERETERRSGMWKVQVEHCRG
ncbi:hypothetical protein PVAG01_00535 [Phlyctema vagabunda]|uniref:Uncharacterized protein n=1 Tax=Phlyctema vagabunda TaxID=108571 RepID=A0ABR4PVZ5_9HELO